MKNFLAIILNIYIKCSDPLEDKKISKSHARKMNKLTRPRSIKKS